MSTSCKRSMALKFTKKKDDRRKYYPAEHHPTCAINRTCISRPRRGAPRPVSAASPPPAARIASAGPTTSLGMPRTPSFSRSRQAFHAKRSGRLGVDVIFNFTWSSEWVVGAFRGLVRTFSGGLGLREFMTGDSGDDKARNGKNMCEFPQFFRSSSVQPSQRPPSHDISSFAKNNHPDV